MAYDLGFVNKIKKVLNDFSNIAVYGTGDGADYFFNYLNMLHLTNKVVAIVDRNDSKMIGQFYNGYEVKKILDVVDKLDAVVIASSLYWPIISERLKLLFEEIKKEMPIIEIYNNKPNKVRKNTEKDLEKYIQYLEERQINKDNNFVELSPLIFKDKINDPKIIAYYLPQFYHIEINDKYHGRGFTEWTNSSQAIPLYTGHEQPHIPYDIGYYDLNNIEVMKRQIELAKKYGIYGFCFHYYWFSGKRIMEKPVNMLLENMDLDIHFCFNWATENWTSVWDGGVYDLIFEQKLQEEDDVKFMNDILPFFRDNRYIKIDGKPVLIIYTALVFPKDRFEVLVHNFRKIAKDNGFPDLYILLTNYNSFDQDVNDYGVDGLVEFPPSYLAERCEKYYPEGYINPYFAGDIFNYNQFVREKKYMIEYKNKNVFRSALVSFDNTARKSRYGGIIFQGASPANYQKWLKDILIESKLKRYNNDNYVFVNSWNEWAEGSHLEPDIRNGYAYLEATREAIYESRELDETYIKTEIIRVENEKLMPHFYILCIESMGDIVACEPIVRYIKNICKHCSITWIIKEMYYDIIAYNPFLDSIKKVVCLSDAIDYCNELRKKVETIIVDCHYNGRRCTKTNRIHINDINPQINERTYFNYGSLLESFSLIAGLEKLTDQPIFYEKPCMKNILKPKKYLVIHCKSAEECKDWQNERWNELVDTLVKENIYIVEVGLEAIIHNSSNYYIDCTHIHELQLIAKIIKDCELFIGVDSGFAHIANCFSKKAVLIFGKYKNFIYSRPYTGYYAKTNQSTLRYVEKENIKNIKTEEIYQNIKYLMGDQ